MLLIPFLACKPAPAGPTQGDSDSPSDSPVDTAPLTFNGTAPPSPVSLPDFAALSQDNAPRGPEDLKGHPTVMWFYPLASSGG